MDNMNNNPFSDFLRAAAAETKKNNSVVIAGMEIEIKIGGIPESILIYARNEAREYVDKEKATWPKGGDYPPDSEAVKAWKKENGNNARQCYVDFHPATEAEFMYMQRVVERYELRVRLAPYYHNGQSLAYVEDPEQATLILTPYGKVLTEKVTQIRESAGLNEAEAVPPNPSAPQVGANGSGASVSGSAGPQVSGTDQKNGAS